MPMMKRVAFAHYGCYAAARKASALVEFTLDEGIVPLTEAIDILPRLSRVEGEFIGSCANDWPCNFVK